MSVSWSLTATWPQVWCFVVLYIVGTLFLAVCIGIQRLQSGEQKHKRRQKLYFIPFIFWTHFTTNTSSLSLAAPAAVAELAPLPSVGLCLSPAPPGGHSPAAASCSSLAAPSGSDLSQPSSPFGPDRIWPSDPSATFESKHTNGTRRVTIWKNTTASVELELCCTKRRTL